MPNNNYVKREDIFPAVTEIAKEIVFGNQDDDKVVDIINSIPAADVEPKRKTGWWKRIGGKRGRVIDRRIVTCSICGNDLSMEGVNAGRGNANYCPNCGANMLKEPPKGECNETL